MDAFLEREFGASLDPDREEAHLQDLLKECMKSEVTGENQKPVYDSITPKPGFCIKTKNDKQEKFFINVCVSDRLPEPKDISEAELEKILQSFDPSQYRVPISIGEPRAEMDSGGNGCTVCDVVVNSSFLRKTESSELFLGFLVSVAIEAIESKYSLSLSKEWIKLKNRKFVGHIQEQFVRTTAKPWIHDMDGDMQLTPQANETLKAVQTKGSAMPTATSAKGKPAKVPKCTICREPVEGDCPEFLVAEIELPEVKSAQSLMLDLGEDRILLQTRSQQYHLDVYLPFNINQDECGAQFDRRSHILTITMPVAPV